MPAKRADGMPTRVCSHKAAPRAKYRDALTRLPDRVLQLAYERNVAQGRRELANYCAIEAGQRLTKRALAVTLDPAAAAAMKVQFEAVAAEDRSVLKARMSAIRARRTAARRAQREARACRLSETMLNAAQVGSPL